MKTHPSVMIAAPKSGSGKTLITCALLNALKQRKLKTSAFKCGPDYIDPMFHKNVIGIPSRNLDIFFTDEKKTVELFNKNNDSEISVIEGVMGLYDGLGGTTTDASSYHLASVLNTPIILVIDARGMGYSIVAEIVGFLSMDSHHLISGVILNKTTPAFCSMIKPIIEKKTGIEVLGYFPKEDKLCIESRYLGLKLPNEIEDLRKNISRASEILEECVDINRIIDIAKSYNEGVDSTIETKLCNKDINRTQKPVIAVAKDEAFCFIYDENIELLEEYGAQIRYFSPLHDECLPENTAGVLLPGGYPEKFASHLSANESMIWQIQKAVESKMPIVAECGGFIYLHKTLITEDKKRYTMAGVIDGECFYTGRLVRFGYVSVSSLGEEMCNDNNLAQRLVGDGEIRGHEFHYFDSTQNGKSCIAKKPVSGRQWDCMYSDESIFAGFLHLYYPSNPKFAENFVNEARHYSFIKWNSEADGEYH